MVMTKRKEFDQVNDDFSDFSLSSPATKIRRLDAELAPIMEEEESSHSHIDFQQSTHSFQSVSAAAAAAADELTPPPPLENQERAIVLFNNLPITNTNININNLHPSPQFSLTSHILSGLKNGNHLWSKHSLLQSSEEHQQHVNNNNSSSSSNQCLAVVPWVESRLPQNALVIEQLTQDDNDDDDDNNPEMMEEADENDVASMDIEDNGGYAAGNGIEQTPFSGIQDFHQCQQQQQQQQHCVVPSQFQNSTATTTTTPSIPPVVWFQT